MVWVRNGFEVMALFRVRVIEYFSQYRVPGPGTPLPDCVINDRQLTIGMVRSILTHNPDRAAWRFMAAIVRPTLIFILDWNRPPDLSLNPVFQNVVRDFSTTARVGELAQAICYSYWQWWTGYRFVADFASLAIGIGLPVPAGARIPDYIMFDPAAGTVALMEAKGTQGRNHASQMAAALRQIRAARAYAPVHRGMACVLALDQPAGAAALHLRDPEDSREVSDSIKHDIFRSSYAAWFDLAGMEEIAHWCRTPLARAERMSQQVFSRLTDRKFHAEDPLQKVVAEALGFDPNRVAFHLTPSITEALRSSAAFEDIKHEVPEFSSAENSMKAGSEILFPDGTAILPE